MRYPTIGMRAGTAASIMCAALASGPAAGADITWKAAIWGPQRSLLQPVEWYAKEVTAKTGGQMKIDFTYGRAKQNESFEMLKSGTADAAYFCGLSFNDKALLVSVLELPMFSPDNTAVMGRVKLALSDHPAIQAELKALNVKMLVPTPMPQYQLMGTRRVAKLDDLKGANVRISRELGKALEEYGAVINPIATAEISGALKSGAIDTAAMAYPYGFAVFKVHENAKYVTDKISLGTSVCFFGVSHKAWDALPAGVQKVMLALRAPAVAQYEGLYAREDAVHIAAFKARGLEFVQFSPTDRARLLAKTVKVWQTWVDEREKQGLRGREVFEFAQAKIREYTR